ncbi:hypothetical protein [Embleya sp. NPDC005575]|uniref:hypothetical protein n=1 Tax=Embleya sp. NPDC005575 TaxID=3156892 RepID=UPI0033BA6E81
MAVQEGLFDPEPYRRTDAESLPYLGADPALSDEGLAGDRYGWLLGLLPTPTAPACDSCRRPTILGAVPLVWVCPRCHPREVSG